jgi:hypothetical protein
MPTSRFRLSYLWGIPLNARTCQKNATWISTWNITFKRSGKLESYFPMEENEYFDQIFYHFGYYKLLQIPQLLYIYKIVVKNKFILNLISIARQNRRQNIKARRMWLYKILSVTRRYHPWRWCILVWGMPIVFMRGKRYVLC